MKLKQKKKFLVFSAHPDDLDFGCAGTVAQLTAEGNEVVYCILTNGEKGTHKVKQTKKEMVAMREREQKAAGKVVGVQKVIFLRNTDGDLEHTKDVRKEVTRVIRRERPDVVLSQDPGNNSFDSFGRFHRDHRITAEIVFDAIYPGVGSDSFFPELAQEDIFPHQIEEVWFYSSEKPNYFVNITATIAQKIAALKSHESQIKDMKDMEARLRKRARDFGKKKGWKYAEAFRRLTF
ncbi:PIG-L family deacetylase [Candidatus Kaiserbacteria bacterium]|nr:PIG-L family deacetylase [Candidatus Kaiserbacteria bacterium]